MIGQFFISYKSTVWVQYKYFTPFILYANLFYTNNVAKFCFTFCALISNLYFSVLSLIHLKLSHRTNENEGE